MDTPKEEIIKQAYINDAPISFSYTKKYWINYGHKPMENSAGVYKGKLYGYGVDKVDGEWHKFVHIMEKGQHYAIYYSDITLEA